MGRRKRAPSRVASQLKALQNVGNTTKVIKEETKLKKERTKAERLKLKEANHDKRVELDLAESDRLNWKDHERKQRRGIPTEPSQAVAGPRVVPQPPPGHFTPLKDEPAAPEYAWTSSFNTDTGVTSKTLLIDPRSGEPVMRKPSAPASVETPHEVAPSALAPWAGTNSSGTPVLMRQPTKAELVERHRRLQGHVFQEPRLLNAITPEGRVDLFGPRWSQNL